jgi:hypothetical protein
MSINLFILPAGQSSSFPNVTYSYDPPQHQQQQQQLPPPPPSTTPSHSSAVVQHHEEQQHHIIHHHIPDYSNSSSLNDYPDALSPGDYASPTPPPSMSGASPAKKGKGGRKKSLRPPSPAILKQRREAANARERKRMNGLNDAFERLREVVPNLTTEQKMSKIETLHMAQTYIKALASLIEREERKEMLLAGGGHGSGVGDSMDDDGLHHHHNHHHHHQVDGGDSRDDVIGGDGGGEFHDIIKVEPMATGSELGLVGTGIHL